MLLAVLTAVLYLPVGGHPFLALDDGDYLTANPVVARGLTADGLAWAFTTGHASNWHPLTWVSHLVDVELFGLEAGAHHLVNVALHALTVFLLVGAARALGLGHRAALWAAGLFALHPLRVESVAWAAQRKDVLAALCVVLALGAHARAVRRTGRGAGAWVLVFGGLGLLAKPTVVTLPVLLLLVDRWPLRRDRSLGALVVEKLPLVALCVAAGLATLWAQQGARSPEGLDLPVRLANAAQTLVLHLRRVVWPHDLAAFYPHPVLTAAGPPSLTSGPVLGALLALASITALVIAGARARPWFAAGWGWFVVALLPTLGLLQVGQQALADRYATLPLLGVGLAVAGAVSAWVDGASSADGTSAAGTRRRLAWGLGVASLLAAAVVTRGQLTHWRSDRTLHERVLAVAAESAVTHHALGVALEAEGDRATAARHYERALELQPGFGWPHVNLGLQRADAGDWPAAIAHYEAALADDPELATAHRNLGVALFATGAGAGALEHLEAAVRLGPGQLTPAQTALAAYDAGVVHHHAGRLEEAAAWYRRALELDPGCREAADALALAQAAPPR